MVSSTVRNAGITAVSRPVNRAQDSRQKGSTFGGSVMGDCDLLSLPASSDGQPNLRIQLILQLSIVVPVTQGNKNPKTIRQGNVEFTFNCLYRPKHKTSLVVHAARGSMTLLKKRQGDGTDTEQGQLGSSQRNLRWWGRLLRHIQVFGKPKQLFSRDGVHMSGLGISGQWELSIRKSYHISHY